MVHSAKKLNPPNRHAILAQTGLPKHYGSKVGSRQKFYRALSTPEYFRGLR